ncbi:hypothetical protein FHS55_002155 [Angulomicrobium tetraedrale]|uniref:Uncharacterized protein n=1 Tax=Ancylobacter tetraedralis TaxID=217068 RepID=A0A839Z9Z8_9HYPH|nr:hypothetical protein [Ancylobacter tetraedralis]MBB3771556.1 hypothetical protein [Ancylobacter tetraedralis]
MRRTLATVITIASLAASANASAEEVTKKFGSWEVSIDTDRFTGQSKVIAMSFQRGDIIAVRCFPKGISIAVGELGAGPGRFDEGMEFDIKFRADTGDIIETVGVAINDKAVELADSASMARQMRNAKEVAFRLSYKGVTGDKVFKLGPNASKALDEVFKACPEPA